MFEHLLRYAAQDHARQTAFAMRTERDGVHLLALGGIEDAPGDWFRGFDHLTLHAQALG
jgi:hypothetical protein